MAEDNTRRHKRYDVQDVSGSLLFTIDVNVINMSIDGMAVESSKRLNVGRTYILKIGDNENVIKLSGNVVWCELRKALKTDEGSVVPVYKAGIKFENVISEKAKDLMNFMEGNVVIRLEKRIFGRFKVKPQKPLNLNSEYDFLVKTISLSGMLIETEIHPDVESFFDMEIKVNGSRIFVKGRIAYVKRLSETAADAKSHLGVEFIEFQEKGREILEAFILNELEST